MKFSGALLVSVLLLAACSSEPAPLTANAVQLSPPIGGRAMGAAYLELRNNSTQDIRITRVASPQLKSVEMHQSLLEGDISRMVKLPEVVIPAGQSVVFEPGAKHLMLRYPANMTDLPLTLQFFTGDDLILSVEATFPD